MPETTKGMYIAAFIEHFAKKAGRQALEKLRQEIGLAASYRAFADYPVESLERLLEEIVRQTMPGTSVEAAMYELGRTAFLTFSTSIAGRVALSLLTHDLAKLGERLPGYYASSNKYGSVSSADVSAEGFRLLFRSYRTYPTYHHGLLSSGYEHMGFRGKVSLRVHKLEKHGPGKIDADFDIDFSRAES
jgi:uncharacterized protein (TIGR02265 family)